MIIASRFNGPPGTGNGGYAAGLVASHMDTGRPIEVTLRLPPPLDTELTVYAGDVLRVYSGAELVAEATAEAMTDDEIVVPVSFDQADSVSSTFRGFAVHPFPTCFVCGPDREPGDGLRLFPGMLPDGRTAAPYVAPPDASPVLLWAALDCPGGWSVPLEARPYVLGRMTALVRTVPAPGERCVVMGQMLGEEGRKAFVRSTLFGPAGDVLAAARATWLAL